MAYSEELDGPLQLHILDGDEDHEIAQGLPATVRGAELFVSPGTEHYSPSTRSGPPGSSRSACSHSCQCSDAEEVMKLP